MSSAHTQMDLDQTLTIAHEVFTKLNV
jgi:hypothetical protein